MAYPVSWHIQKHVWHGHQVQPSAVLGRFPRPAMIHLTT